MRQNDQNNQSDQNEGFSSSQSQQALRSLKSLSAEPSPYLKTRVLAHAREQKRAKVSFFKKYFGEPNGLSANLQNLQNNLQLMQRFLFEKEWSSDICFRKTYKNTPSVF